ncbi:MAG: hypothetical protein AAFV53_29475 [Myxococcota bacterium]
MSGVALAEPRPRRGKGRSPMKAGSLGLQMMIKSGRYRVAVDNASKQLDEDPDNPELHAAQGVAWSRLGYPADALGAFQFSGGAAFYEDVGIEAHATALREVGDGEAAVDLRSQRLVSSSLTDSREFRLWYNLIDDLRVAGRPEEALDSVAASLSIYPNAPATYAQLADCYYAMGFDEEGDAALWTSERLGGSQLTRILNIEHALANGDLMHADALSNNLRQFRVPDPRLLGLRVEVLRQMGDLDEAAALLERSRYRLTEAAEVLIARARVYRDLNDTVRYTQAVHRLSTVYGDHPDVKGVLAEMPATP